MSNRDRILKASVEIFNRSGVAGVTTNHIASELGISPGNLYFHFQNKEEILRQLFAGMCRAVYAAWDPPAKGRGVLRPDEVLESSLEVFWSFRFFHREMYHLRRKDPRIARAWRSHMRKTYGLWRSAYAAWVRAGWLREIADPSESERLASLVLLVTSAPLQFFESAARTPARRHIEKALRDAAWLLLPYCCERYARRLRARVSDIHPIREAV